MSNSPKMKEAIDKAFKKLNAMSKEEFAEALKNAPKIFDESFFTQPIPQTQWTPLTSQEHLDKVWDDMEVGDIILLQDKEYKNHITSACKMKEETRCGAGFARIDTYGFTILTSFKGE